MEQVNGDEAIRLHKQAHRDLFPLSKNLIALIFTPTADLAQDQRQSLTSTMTHRNRTMDQYRAMELREEFLELVCTMKTAVDNPTMNLSKGHYWRSSGTLQKNGPGGGGVFIWGVFNIV